MSSQNVNLVNDKLNAVRQLLGHVDSSLMMLGHVPDNGAYWVELLGHLHRIDQTVQSALRTAVGSARADGDRSWGEIGAALELSRQGAQQRYGAA